MSKPGEGGIYVGDGRFSPINGTIGKYLKGGDANCSAVGSAGGGRSGYFGGGGGADLAGGGGGSSYASPDLYNVILLGGDKTFNSPSGNPVIGHTGDGFIRIEPSSPFTLEKNLIGCKCSCPLNNFILYSAHLFSIGLVSLMLA
ncbi:PE-PGRS protein, putative [Trichomonas vaginalis G3]|uniref:receptor protein-tyrosine kinase n=1 Tax=Trichomonas vaginalis (strain ATCC PRA-98 / G3) TaxID=412133 RepID=A2GFG4_TRIV3|nr:glycine-rich protein family [Trichomonas vaginalis G3]EAX84102.1 PE-PGRS protein, putative [Trichomonas vaginalis G3]KAI5529820.1 glycine-rich protein family [Trichomonas vaginalis G3]|eukprot:XP_001297032.1 PE-PGRS protein [Trichomonas vaginalis G3]